MDNERADDVTAEDANVEDVNMDGKCMKEEDLTEEDVMVGQTWIGALEELYGRHIRITRIVGDDVYFDVITKTYDGEDDVEQNNMSKRSLLDSYQRDFTL